MLIVKKGACRSVEIVQPARSADPNRAVPVLVDRLNRIAVQAFGISFVAGVEQKILVFWVEPVQARAGGLPPKGSRLDLRKLR